MRLIDSSSSFEVIRHPPPLPTIRAHRFQSWATSYWSALLQPFIAFSLGVLSGHIVAALCHNLSSSSSVPGKEDNKDEDDNAEDVSYAQNTVENQVGCVKSFSNSIFVKSVRRRILRCHQLFARGHLTVVTSQTVPLWILLLTQRGSNKTAWWMRGMLSALTILLLGCNTNEKHSDDSGDDQMKQDSDISDNTESNKEAHSPSRDLNNLNEVRQSSHSLTSKSPSSSAAISTSNGDRGLLLFPDTDDILPQQEQHVQQQVENQENTRSRTDSDVGTQTNDFTPLARTTNTKYLEMVVHNVSHTDLVLSLGVPSQDENTPHAVKHEVQQHALFRPRFSAFDLFSRRILDTLQRHCSTPKEKALFYSLLHSSVISYPRYERSDATPRYALVTPRPSRQSMLPVGFSLDQLLLENRTNTNNNDYCDEGKENDEASTGRTEDLLEISLDEMSSLRLRGRDVCKVEALSPRPAIPVREPEGDDNANKRVSVQFDNDDKQRGLPLSSSLHINAIFFPLLSSLMRKWHHRIASKYSNSNNSTKTKIKKVVILVSGVGTPRNWTHTITGNSTQACAELMEIFIKVLYPDVTVVRIHSDTNIFRYDENIFFAKQELMPCIDSYRDAHARGERYPDEKFVEDDDTSNNGVETTNTASHSSVGGAKLPPPGKERNFFNPDWKRTFAVTLSFADGSPARTHAIQASLRPYRPTYFHFWQLKTFWHESKICDDDIEVHSFENMETVPAMEVGKTNDCVQMVVKEMKDFRRFFLEAMNEGRNDIRQFWLRKTKRPVLAVLLVECPKGGGLLLYRGTNMEVSMPTGSLCAERNVIGTALGANPSLKREDLRMIAVLAVPLPIEESGRLSSQLPSPPPGRVDDVVCGVISDQEGENVAVKVAPLSPSSSVGKSLISEVGETSNQRQSPDQLRRTPSIGSFASLVEEEGDVNDNDTLVSSWVLESGINSKSGLEDGVRPLPTGGAFSESASLSSISGKKSITDGSVMVISPLHLSDPHKDVSNNSSHNNNNSQTEHSPSMSLGNVGSNTPVRRISLYSNAYLENDTGGGTNFPILMNRLTMGGGGGGRNHKRTVIVQSPEDINPLRPCGACNEWLKKIAESNPRFKVLTFTDAHCNGVYITPCQE